MIVERVHLDLGVNDFWLGPNETKQVWPRGDRSPCRTGASAYAYRSDLDNHIFTGAEYAGNMGGGSMIEPELSQAPVTQPGTQYSYPNGGSACDDFLSAWLNLVSRKRQHT